MIVRFFASNLDIQYYGLLQINIYEYPLSINIEMFCNDGLYCFTGIIPQIHVT